MFFNCPVSVEHFVRRQTTPQWNIPTREIFDHELVFIMRPGGIFTVEERVFRPQQGDVFYIKPGLLHSLSTTGEPYMMLLAVHFTLPDEVATLPLDCFFRPSNFHHITELLEELEACYEKTDDSSLHIDKWRCNLLLERIIFELVAGSEREETPINIRRMQKLTEYIEANLEKKLTLETLTKFAKIEKSYLMRIFKDRVGQTPIRYITHRRINRAKSLLQAENDLTIAEIAEKCGYFDTFYFSRCFKQETGMSPTKYKNQRWL